MSKIDSANRDVFLEQAAELNALMVQVIEDNKRPLWELMLNKVKSGLNVIRDSKGSQ